MKFRTKPVTKEAVQLTDATFDKPHPNPEHIPGVIYDPKRRCAFIHTLEGTMRADLGDWIITGVNGEHYPCKPDVFTQTYEPAAPEGGNDQEVPQRCMKFVARIGGTGIWYHLCADCSRPRKEHPCPNGCGPNDACDKCAQPEKQDKRPISDERLKQFLQVGEKTLSKWKHRTDSEWKRELEDTYSALLELAALRAENARLEKELAKSLGKSGYWSWRPQFVRPSCISIPSDGRL